MSKHDPKSHAPCPLIVKIREIHSKKKNCRLDTRASLWLHYGSESVEINPSTFHHSIADWLHNAGLVESKNVDDVAAALYCLGVTNSNNLVQKVRQGKLDANGIGKNGRRNGKAKSGR
jgi:hypothetical protein